MDLSQISAEGIIMEHDKESAKSLLELIEELIKTLIKNPCLILIITGLLR